MSSTQANPLIGLMKGLQEIRAPIRFSYGLSHVIKIVSGGRFEGGEGSLALQNTSQRQGYDLHRSHMKSYHSPLSSKMAVSIHSVLLLLLLLGSTNTAKLTNQDREVNKQTEKQVNEEFEEETSNGLNINNLLSIDIDLDKMAAGAEDFVRRFGVDENTLSDVKKYLQGNEMIASTAKSARQSLSKGKDMLRKVSLNWIITIPSFISYITKSFRG